MKHFMVAGLFIFLGLQASADEKLEKMKQETLTHLDSRIQALNSAKSCVSAAQDAAALKKCHLALREERMMGHEAMLEKRKQKIDEQMKRLEAEKAKLQSSEKK
jgi:hypothetical protein